METDAVIRAIDRQEWLEPIEKGLKQGLDSAFQADTANGKPVENALHGVWLGHALHPVLTDIPVGAWTVACVLDLVEEVTGEKKYQAGADAAINIGLAGAVGAAVTGLTDWKEISQEARRAGLVHGVLNLVSAGLYLCSSLQRAKGKRGWARAFSYAAYGISGASAWLGGHLVYANQVGVERTAGRKPPAEFVPLLPVADLEEGKPRRADHEGYPIVLVKKGERIYALAEMCSHLGGPLADGPVEGDCIRCPWHGSLFSLEDGSVKESPATRPQAVFETRVARGQVEVRLRPDLGTAPGPKRD
jgi:nitrite reductase/ring-hydroxylating ferredoxin subunit/uncharacterized membrane protein